MQDNASNNNFTAEDHTREGETSQEIVENSIEKQDAPTSNRRIAKNAMMLYVRMFFSMVVSLYTSRVVLDTLGVEDYGVYGVVGGVVSMLGFLNASMSGATSRFLTFELGRGNQKRMSETFSSALIVHIGIALIVFVLAETVGLWFMTHKLVIPEGRMTAAHWVYQMSIFSAMLGMTQAPYNATIIAHEKMDVYAYVEILNVTLRLLIVYLLVIGNFDKLILYACLVFAVSALIMMVYRIYCIRHFRESHFHWTWNTSILKPLLSFSGWNLYGNLGGMFQQQGTSFVINFFYGVVMNAAVSVGMTVANIVNQFSWNVMTAFRPQIIKNYSTGDKSEMKSLTILALKVIMFIYVLVAIPVFVEADTILNLWLVEVPEHSLVICRLFLISIFFETMRYILIVNIHATGNVKYVSFTAGTVFILIPFLTYFLFRLGLKVEAAFVIIIVANALLCTVNLALVKYYVKIGVMPYIRTIVQIIAVSTLVLFIAFFVNKLMPSSLVYSFINGTIALLIVATTYGYTCFNKDQRRSGFAFIRTKLHL